MAGSVEIIPIANHLKAGMAGRRGTVRALARAEAGMTAMSDRLDGWLKTEMDKLDQARAAIQTGGINATTARETRREDRLPNN